MDNFSNWWIRRRRRRIGSLRTLVFMFQNNSPSEAHDLWGVIDGSDINCKKDSLVLSMILNSISDAQSNQIDIKKSGKEHWEVLHTFHVGMDKVV